ncbi:MAG: hypothetical protein MI685_08200 [Chlorobiales bacterium]|nr:hypothetical protein [Chlorobiales bacterium]
MSPNKPAHIVAFAVSLGIFAYLASALWSAIFIVPLPMEKDAIIDSIEIETGEDRYGGIQTEWHPIEFKNTLEELKYYHNLQMRDRNRYWLYGELIVGGLIGLFVFYIIPKRRNILDNPYDTSGTAFGGIFLGILTVLIVPFVLSWVLPPPVKWFPQEIARIAEMREKDALSRLKVQAKERDSKHNQFR